MMAIFNLSSYNPEAFILLGIPGLEHFHIWISIPFFIIYLVAVLGNGALIYLISIERSLHEPMFLFLSILSATDLVLSNTCVPKAMTIYWWGPQKITFPGCLTQMFFLHCSFAVESAILLAMAFDRYVAICFPLRYTTILTHQMVTKIVIGILSRSFVIILPIVFLLKRLPYCGTLHMPHTYCEHIGVARHSCADISVNIWYGFSVPIMTVLSDMILIGVSYGLILHAIFNLPSKDAHQKALNTCGSHVCVILIFYTPFLFSVLSHRFGHNIPLSFHIMVANLYVVIPPALNPIIYGVKTKQIREKFIHIFLLKEIQ
ncbi:olfactory receptor 52H1-like [Sorex fumeus]|uniref:olfactory receptor 52H1-like n=1 Tax=Sorex fumeus TaxID=62283 RepID=UPI0024ACD041|nr:olfactory receptor 52H1-like [Sorex fumeus]